MMFWKRKSKLFGNGIEPDCSYCANFSDGACRLNRDGPCGGFRYDPLKRTPDGTPALKKHDPGEFKL
jgi:hypothetical protein